MTAAQLGAGTYSNDRGQRDFRMRRLTLRAVLVNGTCKAFQEIADESAADADPAHRYSLHARLLSFGQKLHDGVIIGC